MKKEYEFSFKDFKFNFNMKELIKIGNNNFQLYKEGVTLIIVSQRINDNWILKVNKNELFSLCEIFNFITFKNVWIFVTRLVDVNKLIEHLKKHQIITNVGEKK